MEMRELWIYWQWTHIPEWRYTRQYFWVRLVDNVGRISFLIFFETQLDTSLNKAQHKQELLCGKTIDSGRNVYVIEEPFYFHSTPINLKIKVPQD
jgi:predicted phage tail protein